MQAWLTAVKGGHFAPVAAALPLGTNGQQLLRMPRARCGQLCASAGAPHLGDQLFDAIRSRLAFEREAKSADAKDARARADASSHAAAARHTAEASKAKRKAPPVPKVAVGATAVALADKFHRFWSAQGREL